MALGSHTTRWSSCMNTPVDPAGELDELASTQGLVKRSNTGSDETFTQARISPEASTPPFLPPTSKNLFTKVKIILRPQAAQGWIVPFLPPPFSVAVLTSDGLNTSDVTNALLPSFDQSFTPSSGRISKASRPLLTVSRASLRGTPSTS